MVTRYGDLRFLWNGFVNYSISKYYLVCQIDDDFTYFFTILTFLLLICFIYFIFQCLDLIFELRTIVFIFVLFFRNFLCDDISLLDKCFASFLIGHSIKYIHFAYLWLIPWIIYSMFKYNKIHLYDINIHTSKTYLFMICFHSFLSFDTIWFLIACFLVFRTCIFTSILCCLRFLNFRAMLNSAFCSFQ